MFVLDCSITMAWCFEDESTAYTQSALDALEHTKAIAPALWHIEIGNVLLMAERKRRLSLAEALQFLTFLGELPIMTRPHDETPISTVLTLARQTKLTMYDALYLALAMKESLPIATIDKDVRLAAKHIGVPLWQA